VGYLFRSLPATTRVTTLLSTGRDHRVQGLSREAASWLRLLLTVGSPADTGTGGQPLAYAVAHFQGDGSG
jgi:hypothetical protein